MMDTPHVEKRRRTAAVLLWQSRFRLMLIIAIGGVTLTLEWAGWATGESVIARAYGVDRAIAAFSVLGGLYFGFVALLATRLRTRDEIGTWALPATLIADVVAFNGAVLIGAAPEWYEVALILSMFSLQLSLLYSGWRAAIWTLVLVVAAYLGMLWVALSFGSDLGLGESLWTLAVFTVGMTAFASLQADLHSRMGMVVRAIDRARAGSFSLAFDAESGEEPDGITVVGREYTQMREQLTALIQTDPLTGCYNGRGFEQYCARELARAVRQKSMTSLLALDIDHFKSINDTHGHLVGDLVLKEFGGVVLRTARVTDVAGRVGGEEFAILAPDTDAQGAELFAQRVLDACRASTFSVPGGRAVTVSIGVATAIGTTPNLLRLLRERADAALYAAKRGGRDRSVTWTDGMTPQA
jgi:diguanylate cyclase (GGDEF)-like protein